MLSGLADVQPLVPGGKPLAQHPPPALHVPTSPHAMIAALHCATSPPTKSYPLHA
jgi:hypothetical protein